MPLHQHIYKKEAEPELVCRYNLQNRLIEYTVSPIQRIWSVNVNGIQYDWRVDQGTKAEYFQYFRINGVNSSNMTLLAELRARFIKGAVQQSTQYSGYSEVISSVCEYVLT